MRYTNCEMVNGSNSGVAARKQRVCLALSGIAAHEKAAQPLDILLTIFYWHKQTYLRGIAGNAAVMLGLLKLIFFGMCHIFGYIEKAVLR